MENVLKLPSNLCEKIFTHQFQIDIGNVSEELVTKTIELYVEAISFFTSLIVKYSQDSTFEKEAASRRNMFYQEKIKRLLVRKDVQKCLLGKKNYQRGLDLQKQIGIMKENAPQQAKALVEYFKGHVVQQEKLIEQSISKQKDVLDQRIRRRSISKGKKPIENFKRPFVITI